MAKKQVKIYMDEKLHERLKRIAEKRGISLTTLINRMVKIEMVNW